MENFSILKRFKELTILLKCFMFIFALELPLPTHISGGNHYNLDSWEIIYYTLNTNIVLHACFQINLLHVQCTSQFAVCSMTVHLPKKIMNKLSLSLSLSHNVNMHVTYCILLHSVDISPFYINLKLCFLWDSCRTHVGLIFSVGLILVSALVDA